MKSAALFIVVLMLAVPAASPLAQPFEILTTSAYPADSWLSNQDVLDHAVFPDAQAGILRAEGYGESRPDSSSVAALLTATVQSPGFVSLIHYAAGGTSYVGLSSLPLPAGHHTTLTIALPSAAKQGVTRLVLWDAPPSRAWLTQLARHPNFVDEPVPGLLAQRWFPRKSRLPATRAASDLPWEDRLREPAGTPVGFGATRWPWAAARLGSDLTVHAKDCAVGFSGFEQLVFDSQGSTGVWPLSWSSELKVEFELPAGQSFSRALLVLEPFADNVSGSPAAFSAQDVDVKVNGWLVPWAEAVSILPQAQPSAWQLSPYLQEGLNSIAIVAPSMSGDGIGVEALKLWLQ